jgi:hypothetical protein
MIAEEEMKCRLAVVHAGARVAAGHSQFIKVDVERGEAGSQRRRGCNNLDACSLSFRQNPTKSDAIRARVFKSGSRPSPAPILSVRCRGLFVAGITQVTAG